MVVKKQSAVAKRETGGGVAKGSKALALAERNIKTGQQFAGLMSALMGDVIAGRIAPNVSNAACNAGGKLLKVVEMQHKYGRKVLQLS